MTLPKTPSQSTSRFSIRSLTEKAATTTGTPPVPAPTPLPPVDPRKADVVRSLLGYLAAGIGGGAAVRGLMGVHDYFQTPTFNPLMNTSSIPTPLPVPTYQRRRKRNPERQEKAATAPGTPSPPPQSSTIVDTLARMLPDRAVSTENPMLNSVTMPLSATLATGGLYGGWKLVDWLLKKRQKSDLASQTSEAQREYEEAMAAQYRAAMRAKGAGDDLGIDALYPMVKAAGGPGDLISTVEPLTSLGWRLPLGHNNYEAVQGTLYAAAALSALGAGLATYKWAKGQNKQELLRKAIQMRARQRQFSPTPFYAVPEPHVVD